MWMRGADIFAVADALAWAFMDKGLSNFDKKCRLSRNLIQLTLDSFMIVAIINRPRKCRSVSFATCQDNSLMPVQYDAAAPLNS